MSPPIGSARAGLVSQVGGGGSAIPDSVVSLYDYEDDSNTTTATDVVGGIDAFITGASYSTTAAVGDSALLHDGSDDSTLSQSTVDLSGAGDSAALSLAAYINLQSFGGKAHNFIMWYGPDTNNFVSISDDGSSKIEGFIQVGGAASTITTPISTGSYVHVYTELQTDGTHILKIDNTQEASASTGLDPSNISSGDLATGYSPAFGSNYGSALVDDFAAANDILTSSEIQTLIDRS